jgi:tRNA-Thr(GGU) m(6)t(6)A37 methyltransferase TsaA
MPMSHHEHTRCKEKSSVIEFQPVGVAHSRLSTAGAPPFQSIFSQEEGEIEVFPEFLEGLKSIEGFSHLIILSCFDRATQKSLIEKPLTDGVASHGIFACRHFNRPNPIGISYMTLIGVNGCRLSVKGMDLLTAFPMPGPAGYLTSISNGYARRAFAPGRSA